MAKRANSASSGTPFTPSKLLEQAMIQEIAVSPDGRTIVYSRRVVEDGKYRKRLWRVPAAGGAAEQLTSADANDGSPRFSPDGKTLLFLSDRAGSGQSWLLPLAGGEPRKLAEIEGNTHSAEWSPDGGRVLLTGSSGEDRFVVGDRKDPVARRITDFTWRQDAIGYRDQFTSAFVVPASGGEPVRLTKPEDDVRAAAWSHDGKQVAFVADRDPDAGLRLFAGRAKLWSVPAGSKDAEPKLIAALTGSVSHVFSGAGGYALLGVAVEQSPLWAQPNLYHLSGRKPRPLGLELDRPSANTTFGDLIDPSGGIAVAWQDSEYLLALVADHGATHPYRFGLDGTVERLAGGEVVCTGLATGGGTIAVVATDRGNPAEVYVVENGALRQVTTNGSAWLAPHRTDPVLHRISHPDGHELDVWLLEGRNAPKPGPLALQIHGGPHGSHGPTPWLEMLALADAGVHVIYTNPRGSTGYGEAFTKVIHGNWGDRDASDLLRAVEWAIERGIADPARVGVLGLSYGGYATTWLIGHHPETFAAAVAENPVTDLISMFAGSDLTTYYDDRFVGVGQLPENVDAFLRHSPFMAIHRYQNPLLLLHCEGDQRCPPVQSEMAFAILRSRGRTVEMVRYPEESHVLVGIGRPDRRVDRMERIVDWLTRYL
jgi:dipeptidyl aminopeptidase/acylaminoacyl peptidase